MPNVSIIIPSRDRSDSLLQVLAALGRQDFDPSDMEVVVALNDCRDDSRVRLESHDAPFAIVVVEIATAGAGAARNAAARVATGEILIFLDDDIDPVPGFVFAHVKTHEQARDAVCIGYSRPVVPGDGYFDLQKRRWWEDVFHKMSEPHHRFGFKDLLSGNFSVRRETFENVGAFDERFSCREDYELGARLLKADARFCYCAAAVGDHRDGSSLRRGFQRARLEGAADLELVRLHPELRDELSQARTSRLSRLIRAAARCGLDLEPLILATGTAVLDGLERLNARLAWQTLRSRLGWFFYSQGAAWPAPSTPVPTSPPRPVYDLSEGVAVVGDRLDADRPAVASFELSGVHVCAASGGGMEPLQGRHLPGLLAAHSHAFGVAMACDRVMAADDRVTLVDGVPLVGEIDVASWRLRAPIGDLDTRLLVRSGMRPMGWLHRLPADGYAQGDLRAEIATELPAAVCAAATLSDFETAPAPSPAITVVVCTRDRLQSLTRCLEALRALDYPNYQVLIVDNAPSDDATETYVRALGWPRYVREPRAGLDWARNRGVAEAEGEIVAFTDDDTCADPHWLTAIAVGFGQSEVQAVTGLVAPMRLDTAARIYFEDVYGGMGKGFAPIWRRQGGNPRELLWASACGVGANMAFRRSLFGEVGGFNVALDVGTPTGGGGDIEFFHRVVSSGRTLLYEPSALIWHEHRADWDGLRRQLEDNGCGFVAYLLTVLRAGQASKADVLEFVLRHWIGGWLLARMLRPGRHSRRLVLAEIRGALRGLSAYRRSLVIASRTSAASVEAAT
ncbi:MAG: glycosyltransferase [Caulobacteraceae bacterium]|nr:glycosyltransferase [Caulobacteraceae bacterium]